MLIRAGLQSGSRLNRPVVAGLGMAVVPEFGAVSGRRSLVMAVEGVAVPAFSTMVALDLNGSVMSFIGAPVEGLFVAAPELLTIQAWFLTVSLVTAMESGGL